MNLNDRQKAIALDGLLAYRDQIDAMITELRGNHSASSVSQPKRTVSAAARKRMATAQRARWKAAKKVVKPKKSNGKARN